MSKLEGYRFELPLDEPIHRQLFHEQANNLPSTVYAVSKHDTPDELYDLLTSPSVAIIGPKRATEYGLRCAKEFARYAAALNTTVVTGGGPGVQATALKYTLQTKGHAIVIYPQGLDTHIYFEETADLLQSVIDHGGVVLSACEWSEPLAAANYSERNKLVAAFADTILVCEAGLPSGTFTTAFKTLALNVPVLAVPGSIFEPASDGCNRLIENGARIVTGYETIANALK